MRLSLCFFLNLILAVRVLLCQQFLLGLPLTLDLGRLVHVGRNGP
ncbi:hypothetical protein ACOJBM_06505 [Rhizobium beringeri]